MGKYMIMLFVWAGLQPMAGQVMYPGDANNDGVANYLDLLPVGIGFGMLGEPRPVASENWFAQPFIIWDYFLPTTGVNGGYIDANGDAIIDTLDLDAIVANYDFEQDTAMPMPWQHFIVCNTCPPPILSITYDLDSVEVNGAFQALISVLYPEEIPIDLGALGLALELTYDPDLVVETSVAVTPNTDEETLMFITATSQEAAGYRLPAPGKVQVSASGRGQNAFFKDSTLVAKLEFIVIDDILRDTFFRPFQLEISSLLFLNLKEELLMPLVLNQDSVVLFQLLDAKEGPPLSGMLEVFPNPARDFIRVSAAQPVDIDILRLWNSQGMQVWEAGDSSGSEWIIPGKELPPGVYWLEARRGRENAIRKVIIQ